MVSARDFCQEIHRVKDGMGEGRHMVCSMSVDHPSKPPGNDTVRAKALVGGTVFEANPNGSGTKTLEVRHVDFGGNMPAMAIDKMTNMMPEKAFE